MHKATIQIVIIKSLLELDIKGFGCVSFAFHDIFLNLGTMHNLILDCKLYSAPFLVDSYVHVAIVITMGENFDAYSSRHCFKIQLVSPMLYLLFGVLLSNPCVKMIELYHLSVLLSRIC